MANEFKVKNSLLVEGSTNSVPIIAIRNASTEITNDASQILVTGKAIYDFVTTQGGSGTLAGLTDVQLTDLSSYQFLQYDLGSGKWINVSPTEASLYFWPLDVALVRESSLGNGLYWVNGMLDVSIEGGGSDASITELYNWQISQDASISILRSKDASLDVSIGLLNNWQISQDASIFNISRNASTGLQYWVDINRFGFVNPMTDTSLVFNPTNYTFYLNKTGTKWSYFRSGIKYDIYRDVSISLPGTPPAANRYFIYIDDVSGNLTQSTTDWTLQDTKVPVAIIVYNSTLTPTYQLQEERHSCLIDRSDHYYNHTTRGTQLISGATLSGPDVQVSTLNRFIVYGVSDTIIADEDINQSLPSLSRPDGIISAYTNFYRTGGSTWVWESDASVPFRYTGGGYIQWDNNGTMTQGQHARYYNTYLILTNISGQARFISIPGRAEFSSVANAQAEDVRNFDFSGFSISESVIAYQFTWGTSNSYSTSGKVRLEVLPKRINVATVTTAGSAASYLHNSLAGLQGGTTDQYYHLTSAQSADWVGKSYVDTSLAARDASITYAIGKTIASMSFDTAGLNVNYRDTTGLSINYSRFANVSTNTLYANNITESSDGYGIKFTGKAGFGTSDPSGSFHLYSTGGMGLANFWISGPGEQTMRIYNTNASNGVLDSRTSLKFADSYNPDWRWIMYTDSTATGTEDFTLRNQTFGVVMHCTSRGLINIPGDVSISGDLFVKGMDAQVNSNVVYYDTTTGELTYGAPPASDISTLDINSYVNSSSYYDASLMYRKYPNPSTGLGNTDSQGLYCNLEAGATISNFSLGYIDTNGRVSLAGADASNLMPAVCLNTSGGSTSAGTSYDFLIYGVVKNTGWSLTIGKPVYVSATGTVTSTPPSSATQCVQVIGRAISPNSILFNPSPDFVVLK